jgi:hypothetical protein
VKITRKDTWGEVEGFSYLNIPVKAAALNYIEMNARDTTQKTSPVSIATFKFDVTNKGYYEDIFRFDIRGEKGVEGVVDTQGLGLKPGETKTVTLSAMTPEKIFDAGTSNKIDIYCYSRLNQTATYIGSVTVITEGMYISPLFLIILGLVVLIIFALYVFYKKIIGPAGSEKKPKKKVKKPKPKEKKEIEEPKKKESFFKNIFSEKEKEEKVEKKPEPEPEPEPTPAPEPEKEEPLVDKTAEKEQRKKEKAMLKIKRKQEKQKRKLGK